MAELLARVTEHQGILVIIGADPELKDPEWAPVGNGRIGCVVLNTKNRLGVSKEALELLKKVRKGHDSIGDVDWFRTPTPTGNSHAFGWLGPVQRLVDPAKAEASRQYNIGECVDIPNDVPDEAKAGISRYLASKAEA